MPLAETILQRVLLFIPVLFSLSVHEWAHARVAYALGDSTAKDMGRMTIDPTAHIDVVGTLALPLLGIPFGFAKPVPVNPMRFHPGVSAPFGMLLTAAAGPLSNLVMGIVSFALLLAGHRLHAFPPGDLVFEALLERCVVINAALAVFNLLPIPPLDGSRIVDGIIPSEHSGAWRTAGFAVVVATALSLVIVGGSWLAGFEQRIGYIAR
jgi:Zn-dependent protease